MDDGAFVDVVDGGQDALFEFLLGGDGDMAQHRASKLGEEAFDEVEPGAVLGVWVKAKRPAGCVASQALASLEMWAE
jgi:hypothetical protein